jgi:hypothetical protein
MKPFWGLNEVSLKRPFAGIAPMKRRGAIMLITILNSIYRELIRASLSGAKITGA